MPDSNRQPTPAEILALLTNLPPGGTIVIERTAQGDITVNTTNPAPTKEEIIAARFAALRGVGITISDAAEKYGVPRKAVEGWIYRSGYVHFVDRASWPKLVDEAEIALCAEIYHERQETGLTGVPFFDDDGAIIDELKRPELSAYRRRKREQG